MARTHGPQTIHRPELTAAVLVCEWCHRAVVHTDSTSVLRVFMKCRHAQTEEELIALDGYDMVQRLFRAIARGTQEIHKVKAHQTDLESLPDLAVYAALGNQLADEVAVATCRYFQRETSTPAHAMYHDLQEDKEHLLQLLNFSAVEEPFCTFACHEEGW